MAKAAAKKKPQGASRNSGKAPGRKPAPGWLWLVLGLAAGLFVAFLVHLSNLKKADSQAQTPASASADAAPADKPASSKPEAAPVDDSVPVEEPRFDFYTLLPNQEVLPDKATAEATGQVAEQAAKAAADKAAKAAAQADDSVAKPPATENQTAYYLQAGSFKSQVEADKRRASILLLGLPVKVQTAPRDGETWYRVVVGPLKGKTAQQSARATLSSNGIDSVSLKQG